MRNLKKKLLWQNAKTKIIRTQNITKFKPKKVKKKIKLDKIKIGPNFINQIAIKLKKLEVLKKIVF